MTEEEQKAIEIVKNIEYNKNIFMHESLAIAKVLSIMRKQQKESEKKDKIIDEMAEELENQFLHCEPCWLDNEVDCKNYTNCIDCIKQYFEKKAEGNDYEDI